MCSQLLVSLLEVGRCFNTGVSCNTIHTRPGQLAEALSSLSKSRRGWEERA